MRVTLTTFLSLDGVMQAPLDKVEWNNSTLIKGSGKRLFGERGNSPAVLKLADIKATSTGVVIHIYQPAGKPAHGSFTLEEPHRERDQRARQAAARGSGEDR